MEKPEQKVWLDALFAMMRHPRATYKAEALEMLTEVCDKHVRLADFFGPIKLNPRPGFEQALALKVDRIMKGIEQ